MHFNFLFLVTLRACKPSWLSSCGFNLQVANPLTKMQRVPQTHSLVILADLQAALDRGRQRYFIGDRDSAMISRAGGPPMGPCDTINGLCNYYKWCDNKVFIIPRCFS